MVYCSLITIPDIGSKTKLSATGSPITFSVPVVGVCVTWAFFAVWPPHSPDLTSLDLFLGVVLRE
jgi:hypothetical protein